MALSEDERREIKEEIWKAFRETYKEQGLTMAQHMTDHRWAHNVQEGANTIRKASYWTLTVTAVSALLGLIWCAITGKL